MIITAIVAQKRNPARANIYIDNAFAFGLDNELVLRYRLHINQELSPAEIKELQEASDFFLWYNKSLNFLSFRPRSQKEIELYLQKHKVDGETVKIIVEKLHQQNLIDDHSFAKWFLEQRVSFRPRAKQVLIAELRQKGIPSDIIKVVLTEIGVNEAALATSLLDKKRRAWQSFSLEKQAQKAAAYLAQKGFAWDTIKQAVRQKITQPVDDFS